MSSKFCTNCGSKMDAVAVFCPTCGMTVEKADQSLAASSPPIQQQPPQQIPYAANATPGYAPLQAPGYTPRDKSYFGIGNLFSGIGDLITNTWTDAIIIYVPFLLFGLLISYILSLGIAGTVVPPLEDLFGDDFDIGDPFTVDLIVGIVFALVASLVLAMLSPFANIPFLRRLDNYEHGREESYGTSFSYGLQQLVNFILVNLLLLVIRIGYIVIIYGGIFAIFLVDPLVGVAAIIAGSVFAIYMELRLFLAVPNVAILREPPIDAITNSWNRTKGNTFKIFLVLIAMGIISGVPSSVVGQFSIVLIAVSWVLTYAILLFVGYLFQLPVRMWFAAGTLFYTRLYHGETQTSKTFKSADNRMEFGEAAGPVIKP